MERTIGGKQYWVSIISHARAENMGKMTRLVGKATWYVGHGEGDDYLIGNCPVVESGKLCESRNKALRDAFERNLPCIQLSDDLKKIELAYKENIYTKVKEIEFSEAITRMGKSEKIFKLIGVAPTNNAFFWSGHEYAINKFIIGDFIMVRPSELFFDEGLRLKEDYDYTLQHITTFGGVQRCDNIMPAFAHRSNKGGAVEYRDNSREQEAIMYLKTKWGRFIRDNAKRPNEILLNL